MLGKDTDYIKVYLPRWVKEELKKKAAKKNISLSMLCASILFSKVKKLNVHEE